MRRRGLLPGLVLGLVALAGPQAAAGAEPARALALLAPARPQAARDFRAATPEGGSVSLADFRGKVLLLNFWATWCVPCKEEMPAMERLHRRFRDQGLVVLAVSADADGARAVAPFVREHRLTFPVALDPGMTVAGLYSVWALPSTFIIDRQGRQVYFASGPREWDGPAAAALFESLLRR